MFLRQLKFQSWPYNSQRNLSFFRLFFCNNCDTQTPSRSVCVAPEASCAPTPPRPLCGVWIFNLWNMPPMFILEIFIITMFGDGSLIYEHKHMRLYSYRRLCIKMTRFSYENCQKFSSYNRAFDLLCKHLCNYSYIVHFVVLYNS